MSERPPRRPRPRHDEPLAHPQGRPSRQAGLDTPSPSADRGAPLRTLRRRIVVLVIVLLLMLGTLVGRLTQVQLVQPSTANPALSSQNPATLPDTTEIPIPAVRGRILDRNGVPLIENTSYPALVIDRAVLADLPEDGAALFEALSEALDIPAADLQARTTSCGAPGAALPPVCTRGPPAAPAIVVSRLDPAEALAIAERPELYPGVSVDAVPTRAYAHPEGVLAPHVLGYLGQVTPEDITASDGALTDGELIGRAGLESEYDAILRGTPGSRLLRVDPRGVPVETLTERDPIPGKDLRTTLDARVQAVTEQTLADTIAERRTAGAVADSAAAVVLDLRDGGVLALASYPTYDPEVWVGGITDEAYASLTSPGSGHPLLNRVTETGLPPASTFKVISMPATIAAGGSLTGKYSCESTYVIGGREFSNFRKIDHGMIDLHEAMEVSCDTLFYRAAYESWLAQGGTKATDDSRDPFIRTAREFGLGEPTGIDLPGEIAGRIPDRAWRTAQWEANKERWCERADTGYPEESDRERDRYLTAIAKENCQSGYLYRGGDAANFSIGQGDVLTTPLQMAQVMAAVATGGSTHVPRLAGAFVDVQTGAVDDVPAVAGEAVPLRADVGAYLRSALESVVTSGTAVEGFRDFPLEQWPVAGKTGSAEGGHGNDVSWFVSYAPADAPRYVVAVAVTQAGLGSDAAVPVSRKIHETLFAVDQQWGAS